MRDTDRLYFPRGIVLEPRPEPGVAVRPERRSRSTSPAPGTSTPRETTPACTPGRARPRRSTPVRRRRGRTSRTQKKYTWMKAPRYDGARWRWGRWPARWSASPPGTRRCAPWSRRCSTGWRSAPSALFSTLGRIAARGMETVLAGPPDEPLVRRAGRADQGRGHPDVQRGPSGSRAAGPRRPRATATSMHRAARWATGCRSRTARSPATSASSPAPGTARRATRRVQRAPTRRH